MFTGIIEELGTVEALEMRPAGARLKVRCAAVLPDMTIGASIAVNGVCLTAVERRPDSFSADLAPETLRLTNLGDLEALPLAGGIGRRRRVDAIRVHNVTIHPILPDEFAIEGYVHRDH